MKTQVLQKGKVRYTFIPSKDGGLHTIDCDQMTYAGAAHYSKQVTAEQGNKIFSDLVLNKGFKLFRSLHEVSWYATIENNTPYKEEWAVQGAYLIPLNSHSVDSRDWED